MINLDLGRVEDTYVRKALKDIQDAINDSDIIQARYQMYEIQIRTANSALEIIHNLGFVPTDIIITKSTGSAFTFVWDKFTDQKIVINATGAATIRLYLGRNNGVVPIGTN